MEHTLFSIIVGTVILNFILERGLEWLNLRQLRKPLPDELKDILNEAQYKKSLQYKREKAGVETLSSSLEFAGLVALLIFGGFAWADQLADQLTASDTLRSLAFVGILFCASTLAGIPVEAYSTFVIEEKYGFNKTTVRTFVADSLKGFLLSVALGGALFYLILHFYSAVREYFWLCALGVITAFSLVMNMFYSQLIVPLFNRQTPLEEGTLRLRIEDFAASAGFALRNIYVIDGSKRTTKANAYFSGLGPKKRIVLYDTLINQLTSDEVVAVLAHEIGHYKKRHSLWGLIYGFIHTAVLLYIFSIFISNPLFTKVLGVESEVPLFHIGLIAFGFLYAPISLLPGILYNLQSRRHEYQADAFATAHGLGEALISGLKKLSANSFSNLTPHPAYVFAHYSHPPLLQRIRAIRNCCLPIGPTQEEAIE